jgi:glycosyltransferase involved in cell wall biosynthesis
LIPVTWRTALAFWREGRYASLRASRSWKGVQTRYPIYFYVPRIMRWINGFTLFLSLLPQWMAVWRERPQAIYATWLFPDGFAAVLLGRLFRLPVVVKVHGTDVEHLDTEHLRRRLAVWALNRASAVVSVSRYLRDKLIAHGVAPEKIALIYNGIDSERFHPRDRDACRAQLGLARDASIVLYIGNLKPDKGPLDLLSAVETICAERGMHVYFLGDGPVRKAIQERIECRRIGQWVHVCGHVMHDLIPVWMNAADLVCLPSYHEGVPNVLLEAIACGVPVLATDVGGIPEAVTRQSGVLVPPEDPEALRTALIDMLNQRWDRDAVVGSSTAGTWQANAAQIMLLLEPGEPCPDQCAI